MSMAVVKGHVQFSTDSR